MEAAEEIYYNKEALEVLRRQLESVSPATWHKIMNPYCGRCLAERGKALIEGKIPWKEQLDGE